MDVSNGHSLRKYFFILKPSEKDPSCSIRLAELFCEAGLPNGVLNIINGGKEVVDSIIENKDISAVSFVGSTPIAKYIYEHCAKNEKEFRPWEEQKTIVL